jgi:hypothetical protein
MTSIMIAIRNAREYIPNHHDYFIAVYMLRDYPEVEEVGLKDLAWAHTKQQDATKSEAIWFVDEVEKRIKEMVCDGCGISRAESDSEFIKIKSFTYCKMCV